MAAARGVPVRLVALGFMAALAVAVGLSSLAIGAILSTALLIGPAATALRLTNRIGQRLVAAAVIGVAATWLGVLLAYDSFYWGTDHNALPVSSFIVGLTFAGYLALRPPRDPSGERPRHPARGHGRRGCAVTGSCGSEASTWVLREAREPACSLAS